MPVRILHCGNSLDNYYLCINEKVVGFTQRGAESGDLVYVAVKVGKKTVCGARGILAEETDTKPWEDADRYKLCLFMKDVQFCEPFELNILSSVGGKNWHVLYLQRSKSVKSQDAIILLQKTFESNKRDSAYIFPKEDEPNKNQIPANTDNYLLSQNDITEDEFKADDSNINIMGTFQTINFLNESSKTRGLEHLVNSNFHNLFSMYPENNSLLMQDNRMFITSGFNTEQNISGIRGIPDALLIVFNRHQKNYFQINLIEYECYGEKKTRSVEKSNYFNGHIIPQLMRFASTFSIVTDKQIREETIKSWVSKIISYIYSNPKVQKKVTQWIKEINPDIPEQLIALKIQELLVTAFRFNIRVILIIDELSGEQKDTVSNVIQAFKLENGSSINFIGYTVRLEQKINLLDKEAEYALSIQ